MSISFDGALEVLNLDVQDLVGLSQEEIQKEIETVLPELSSTELEDFMKDLDERLSEIKGELLDLENGYQDDLDAAQENDNTESEARYELRLKEVNDALNALDEIDDAALDVAERFTRLNVETDQDYSITYDTNDLNSIESGDVMTIKCLAGSQEGLFADSTGDLEEGVVDTNGDGFIDYDEANAEPLGESLSGQDIFFQVNSGDSVSLVSHIGDISIFQVQTVDGKTFTVKIEGDSHIYFSGSNYADENLLSSWPDDLLKRCHDGDDTKTFYDHVYEDQISDAVRLGAIEGYNDIISQATLDAVWTEPYLTANADNLASGTIKSSSEAKIYYDAAINKLFGYIDDDASDKGSISELWAEIFQEWTTAGLNDFDFSTLISNLVMGVGLGGSQLLFQTFFAPIISTLEGYFTSSVASEGSSDAQNALEKMVITMLETYGGVGTYADVFNTAYAHEGIDENGNETLLEGIFADHATNQQALEMLTDFIPLTGWATLTGAEQSALDNEIEIGGGEGAVAEAQNDLEDLNEVQENGETYLDSGFDAMLGWIDTHNERTTENKMREFINRVENNVSQALAEGLEGNLLLDALKDTIGWYTENRDDLMNNFVSILRELQNSGNEDLVNFANSFLENREIVDYMLTIINLRGSLTDNAINNDEEDNEEFLNNI